MSLTALLTPGTAYQKKTCFVYNNLIIERFFPEKNVLMLDTNFVDRRFFFFSLFSQLLGFSEMSVAKAVMSQLKTNNGRTLAVAKPFALLSLAFVLCVGGE